MELRSRPDITESREVVVQNDIMELYKVKTDYYLFIHKYNDVTRTFLRIMDEIEISVEQVDVSDEKTLFRLDGVETVKTLNSIISSLSGFLGYNDTQILYSTLHKHLEYIETMKIRGEGEGERSEESRSKPVVLRVNNVVQINGFYLYTNTLESGEDIIRGEGGGGSASDIKEYNDVFFTFDEDNDEKQKAVRHKWLYSLALMCSYCMTGNRVMIGNGSEMDKLVDVRGIKKRTGGKIVRKGSSRRGILVALQMIEDTDLYFNLVRGYQQGIFLSI